MGYSIYLITNDEDAAKRMAEHLRLSIADDWLEGAQLATNFDATQCSLSYASKGRKRWQVGFDYSSWICEVERAFAFDVVKWAASTLGLTHYCYDGCELIRVDETKSSLYVAWRKPQLSRVKAAAVRALCGPSKIDIQKAQRRLRHVKNGWVSHAG